MKAVMLAAILACGAALPASAWDWLKVEDTPSLARAETEDQPIMGQCIAAILAAEQAYGIPNHLLLALGLQEAGWQSPDGLTIWPWSVNAAGEGRRFATRAEAESFVRRKQASGVQSIDVGCLQINLRWHPEAFSQLSQGFDASQNVDYAAQFLRSLYEESGDWRLAAGRYHSRSAGPQATYLAGLDRNQAVVMARIGYFTTLAAHGPAISSAEFNVPAAPTYRSEGAIWGADLAGSEGALRTLYSAQDLQPVLPQFLAPEA